MVKTAGRPSWAERLANGRHQVKLYEPEAAETAPEFAPFLLLGSLQFSETCLRVYGHPQLLKIAEEINGEDFAPFNESLFIKEPGIGAAVSWHQDGSTHWDNPDFDGGIHGFNFMAQVYGSTAVTASGFCRAVTSREKLISPSLWKNPAANALPELFRWFATPVTLSYAIAVAARVFCQYGLEPRITVNMGFPPAQLCSQCEGAGTHNEVQVFDEALIAKRSEVIGYGIDARRQRFPDETPFEYKPFVKNGLSYKWDDRAGIASRLQYARSEHLRRNLSPGRVRLTRGHYCASNMSCCMRMNKPARQACALAGHLPTNCSNSA